jgi:hypothetical protein
MSPFKSEAQRRKFGELVKQGKMQQSVFDEWNDATKGRLPERLEKKGGKRETNGASHDLKPNDPIEAHYLKRKR